MPNWKPKRSRIDLTDPNNFTSYRGHLHLSGSTAVPPPRRTLHRAQVSSAAEAGTAAGSDQNHSPPHIEVPDADDPSSSSDSNTTNDDSENAQDSDSVADNERESPAPSATWSDAEFSQDNITEASDEEELPQDNINEASVDEELPTDDTHESSDDEIDPKAEAHRKRAKMSQDYDLDGTVIPNVTLSRFAILVMIIHSVKRFALTDIGLEALIELINVILGAEVIPASKQIFRQVFASDTRRKFYLYCTACSKHLGESSKCKIQACPACNAKAMLGQAMLALSQNLKYRKFLCRHLHGRSTSGHVRKTGRRGHAVIPRRASTGL